MSPASEKQSHENKSSLRASDSRQVTAVRIFLTGLVVLLTFGGTYLVLHDVFEQRLTEFLKKHLSGLLGLVAIFFALGCTSLLRKLKAPPPEENKPKKLDKEIRSQSIDSKPELKWLRKEVAFYRSFGLRNCRLYWIFKVPSLVAAALIPICALSLNQQQWLTALLGALIAICEGIMHIGQFHENWLRSVATREQLERELYLFTANASVYTEPNTHKKATATLTERVIAIMQNEQAQWLEAHRSRAPNETSSKPAQGNPVPPPATTK